MMDVHTVLLADDDPGLRRLVAATLGNEDFQLLQAADGDQALEVARAQHPNLILLDINMPGPSGLEVCQALKQDPATHDIKIVMLTASGSDADKERAVAAQADDYFIKPFSPVALLDKIYDLLA